jgi:enoyl-CoA hydratase
MTVDERDTEARVVVIESRARQAIIRLNRPAEKNQLSIATLTELDAAVNALVARTDIAAIIFTGTLDVFASGANIRELRALTTETACDFARRGQSLFQKIAGAAPLTIAAVNGYCMGGGLDLALCCDLRCASTNAVFAHPGARLGIITGWGGTQRLPRLIGAARAIELFTTARRVHADEAVRIGLITAVGDLVLDVACEMAQRHLNARARKTRTA